MKKVRIIVALLILAFSFGVKAEVLFEIDCNNTEISNNKSVSCEGNLIYEDEGITDIELSYNTNLSVSFTAKSGFTLSKNNGRITIHTNTPLSSEIMDASTIMSFTLISNDSCDNEETITFSNIKVNNYNEVIDDVEETFTISKDTIEEKKNNICTLDSLWIEEDGKKTVIPNFDKNKFEYKGITVSNEKVFVDAIRTHEKSSASNLGFFRVPKGEELERNIIVEAEDGTKCIYKLFIKNVTPKETPTNTPKPTATPSATPKVTITPTSTIVLITPSPTPTVEKKEEIVLPEEKEEVKSNDNNLKTLELYDNKKKIDFKFDSKKDKFNIEVDDIKKITIKATLNSDKATFVSLFGPRDVNLDVVDNEILIKVKAENDDIKTYILNIHVNKKSSDSTLSSLKINDIVVDLDKNEITVANDVIKTKIEAVANNDKATIKYEDMDLVVGNNEIIITVTAEDGTIKEYVVNVIREEKVIEPTISPTPKAKIEKEEKSSSNIIYYVILSIVIILIIITIFIIKKRKSKKDAVIEEII